VKNHAENKREKVSFFLSDDFTKKVRLNPKFSMILFASNWHDLRVCVCGLDDAVVVLSSLFTHDDGKKHKKPRMKAKVFP